MTPRFDRDPIMTPLTALKQRIERQDFLPWDDFYGLLCTNAPRAPPLGASTQKGLTRGLIHSHTVNDFPFISAPWDLTPQTWSGETNLSPDPPRHL